MGGSQIWLEEGEQLSVSDMIKCIAVVSANDCAVAMAEHICGSEAAFTKRMNERAQALGMENTHFLNSTGLTDDPAHYTTARDIAVMSRALLAYPHIRDYSTIWMDTVRDGRFGLANTNKLIHAPTRFLNDAEGELHGDCAELRRRGAQHVTGAGIFPRTARATPWPHAVAAVPRR